MSIIAKALLITVALLAGCAFLGMMVIEWAMEQGDKDTKNYLT